MPDPMPAPRGTEPPRRWRRLVGERGLGDSVIRTVATGGTTAGLVRLTEADPVVTAPVAAAWLLLDRAYCRATFRQTHAREAFAPPEWSSAAMAAAAGEMEPSPPPRALAPLFGAGCVAVVGVLWWLLDPELTKTQPTSSLVAFAVLGLVLGSEAFLSVWSAGTSNRYRRYRSEVGTQTLSARAARQLPAVRRSEAFVGAAGADRLIGAVKAGIVLMIGGVGLGAWGFVVPAAGLIVFQSWLRSLPLEGSRVVISRAGLTTHLFDAPGTFTAWPDIASFAEAFRPPPETVLEQVGPDHIERPHDPGVWVVVANLHDGTEALLWPLSYPDSPFVRDPRQRARTEAARLEQYRPTPPGAGPDRSAGPPPTGRP